MMRRSARIAGITGTPGSVSPAAKKRRPGAQVSAAGGGDASSMSTLGLPPRILARRYDNRAVTDSAFSWCPGAAAAHLAAADPRIARHIAAHGSAVAESVIDRRWKSGLWHAGRDTPCGAKPCSCVQLLGVQRCAEIAMSHRATVAGAPASASPSSSINDDDANFAALAKAVVYQQLAGRAASTILERTVALCLGGPAALESKRREQAERKRTSAATGGPNGQNPNRDPNQGQNEGQNQRRGQRAEEPFPSPSQVLSVPEPLMRSAGLSAAKAASLRALAIAFLDPRVAPGFTVAEGDPPRGLLRGLTDTGVPDAVAVHRLVAVRGIGPWTAEIFLLGHLGRPDVIPTGDLTVARFVAAIAGLGPKPKGEKAILDAAEIWRPYRSFVSFLSWKNADAPQAVD